MPAARFWGLCSLPCDVGLPSSRGRTPSTPCCIPSRCSPIVRAGDHCGLRPGSTTNLREGELALLTKRCPVEVARNEESTNSFGPGLI